MIPKLIYSMVHYVLLIQEYHLLYIQLLILKYNLKINYYKFSINFNILAIVKIVYWWIKYKCFKYKIPKFNLNL